jgi:hypothetical protein
VNKCLQLGGPVNFQYHWKRSKNLETKQLASVITFVPAAKSASTNVFPNAIKLHLSWFCFYNPMIFQLSGISRLRALICRVEEYHDARCLSWRLVSIYIAWQLLTIISSYSQANENWNKFTWDVKETGNLFSCFY